MDPKSLVEWLYNGNSCVGQRERIWKDDQWLVTFTIDYEYNNENVISELQSNYTNGIASNLKKIKNSNLPDEASLYYFAFIDPSFGLYTGKDDISK